MNFARTIAPLLTCCCLLGSIGDARADQPAHQRRRLRRPLKLQLDATGDTLLVGNRCGSVSLIDLDSKKLVDEIDLVEQLSELTFLSATRLAVLDESRSQLLLLAWDARRRTIRELHRIPLSRHPVSVTARGDRLHVASLWSRRLTLVKVSADRLTATRVIDLPFAPRGQTLLPDGKTLIVADAFGGQLAIVDVARGQLTRSLPIAGHQIRAMTVSNSGKELLIPHQLLRDEATTHDGVHWGGVMSNVIRTLPIERLLRADSKKGVGIEGLFYLGHPGEAYGDPTKLVQTSDGRHIVAFAGIGQVGVSDPGANYYRGVNVGDRPTDVIYDKRRGLAYAANTFDDSVSVIAIKRAAEQNRIALGPRRETTFAEQGERHFYNAKLAVDGWFSCNSCHVDGHTNGQRSDNLGDGSFGAPKRVLSLLGVSDTAPWAWDGQSQVLEQQIHASIVKTMRGAEPPAKTTQAIAAFLLNLRPPPSVDRARGVVDAGAVKRGRVIFKQLGCADCHQSPTYTSPSVYDVRLRDELGGKEFNPPSLRGVSQRQRLFHDNSAESLEAVLDGRHNLAKPLTKAQRTALLTFLRSL